MSTVLSRSFLAYMQSHMYVHTTHIDAALCLRLLTDYPHSQQARLTTCVCATVFVEVIDTSNFADGSCCVLAISIFRFNVLSLRNSSGWVLIRNFPGTSLLRSWKSDVWIEQLLFDRHVCRMYSCAIHDKQQLKLYKKKINQIRYQQKQKLS